MKDIKSKFNHWAKTHTKDEQFGVINFFFSQLGIDLTKELKSSSFGTFPEGPYNAPVVDYCKSEAVKTMQMIERDRLEHTVQELHAENEKLRQDVQAAVEAERERWINQPANQHDEAIRKAERERIEGILRKMADSLGYEELYIDDILAAIKEEK